MTDLRLSGSDADRAACKANLIMSAPVLKNTSLPGDTLEHRARTIAGELAECGVRELFLVGPGQSEDRAREPLTDRGNRQRLPCRATDLPTLLITLPPDATIEDVGGALRISRAGNELVLGTLDTPVSRRILERLGVHSA